MYYYEVSWSWHDDYIPFTLKNEKFFDKEEFKKLVDESTKIAYEKLFDEENRKEIMDKNYIGFCRWNEIASIVIENLKKYGFEELKITAGTEYFGLYILEAYDLEAGNKKIGCIFKEELIDKIIEHNKLVERRFFEGDIEDVSSTTEVNTQ